MAASQDSQAPTVKSQLFVPFHHVKIVVLARILQIYPITLARVLIVSPTKTAKQ